MRSTRPDFSKRAFNTVSAALVPLLGASLLVISSASARADDISPQAAQCASAVQVYAVAGPNDPLGRPDGSVDLYNFTDPLNGSFSWGETRRGIGNGWTYKTFAGQGGRVYSAQSDINGDGGLLKRFRWNTTTNGWELGDTIGSGWARFTTSEYRNRISVDEKGRFFVIDDK